MRAKIATLGAAAALAGCGNGSDSETAGAGEEKAAQHAVTTFVNEDDCSVASDAFLEDSFPVANDPRAECERDSSKRLQPGEYRVKSTTVEGGTATVVLALDVGGTRTYGLVKDGDRWLVDSFDEELVAPVADLGEPLDYRESFEINGSPIDVRLTITVESFREIPTPQYYPLLKPGRALREIKVSVRSESSDVFDLSVADFELVEAQGRRYGATGNPVAFEPTLGHEVTTLSPGDKLTGFAGFEVPPSTKAAEVRYRYAGSSQPPLTWSLID